MTTTTRTVQQLRHEILDLLPDLQRERDAMPHMKQRLGQPSPVDPATERYRCVSRAIDHLLEAANEMSYVDAWTAGGIEED